jgi:hypothetical protein
MSPDDAAGSVLVQSRILKEKVTMSHVAPAVSKRERRVARSILWPTLLDSR